MITVEGGKVKRRRLPAPVLIEYHDCTYVEERNKLIPEAQHVAKRQLGEKREEDVGYGNRWTKAFANAMEVLWRQRRLQSTS